MNLHGKYTVTAIKKKTQAKFFRELEVGGTFELSYSLNGMYRDSAPYIYISQNGEQLLQNSASQLSKNLSNFELQEVFPKAKVYSLYSYEDSEIKDVVGTKQEAEDWIIENREDRPDDIDLEGWTVEIVRAH